MEKIYIKASLKDAETGKPYHPGEYKVDEDVPLASAARFVAEGYAEEVEEEKKSKSKNGE